jgi:hypothetical protein
MAVCFIIIGSLYARYGHTTSDEVQLESVSAQWVVIVMIYIFVANFSWSWAVVSATFVPSRTVTDATFLLRCRLEKSMHRRLSRRGSARRFALLSLLPTG